MRKIEQSLSLELGTVTLLFLAAALTGVTLGAHAQTFTSLYSFQCQPDGDGPWGSLTLDAAGNLYGTTFGGGNYDLGTVFKISPQGVETILHHFTGADGANPQNVNLVFDAAGNLYGTTIFGGPNSNGGVVFKLEPDGTETTLHNFRGPDGEAPHGLSIDQGGNLYGTTALGGLYRHCAFFSSCGTVFKITTKGTETLYKFTGSPGPSTPDIGVTLDPEGNLYGTSEYGGTEGYGTVFEVNSAGYETVLLNLHGTAGQYPISGLLRTAGGRLYGTSYEGAASDKGAVWKIDGPGKATVLHQFGGAPDGAGPVGTLIEDSAGQLFGTTANGGTGQCNLGCGTIYEISAAGVESVLYSFPDQNGGFAPEAGLVMGSAGNLYGTTKDGGNGTGCGTVFKYTP